MSEFIFLYRGGTRPGSAEEGQKVMQKWVAWFQELAAAGHVVDRGQPLEGTGKLVKGGSKTIVDGPFAEAKDIIGGFSVVKAPDIAAAAALAKGCPILERGGDVEVRPVMQMAM
ncbi:MAG: YciI family protein [Gemmatimonadales bacterium]